MNFTFTQRYNNDRFANMRIKDTTKATMTIIDAIQLLKPEQQLAGIAASFLLLCERYEREPQDIFVLIKNIMKGADGRAPEFKAVEMYMREQLK